MQEPKASLPLIHLQPIRDQSNAAWLLFGRHVVSSVNSVTVSFQLCCDYTEELK